MYTKIDKTAYPPEKLILIWDGDCGFCKYWVQRIFTDISPITPYPYQDIAHEFPDVPLKIFKEASRLIDIQGVIYSGPDSLYKSLEYKQATTIPLHKWYSQSKIVRWISDHGYSLIARNRNLAFKITKLMWGTDPYAPKSYYLFYLVLLVFMLYFLF